MRRVGIWRVHHSNLARFGNLRVPDAAWFGTIRFPKWRGYPLPLHPWSQISRAFVPITSFRRLTRGLRGLFPVPKGLRSSDNAGSGFSASYSQVNDFARSLCRVLYRSGPKSPRRLAQAFLAVGPKAAWHSSPLAAERQFWRQDMLRQAYSQELYKNKYSKMMLFCIRIKRLHLLRRAS